MAKCVSKTRCPECASIGKDTRGDNLGVFDDGSTYCFSCGYIGGRHLATSILKSKNKVGAKNKLFLPSNNGSIDPVGLRWLTRYDITADEIEKYKIYWNNEKKVLVFPWYNDRNELIFYQLRYFEGDKRWKSMGDKPLLFLGDNRSSVVLVEDVISAIKVSRITTAVPLFGSSIDTKKLLQIRKQFDNIIIWLDYDKANDKKTKKIISACKAAFKETTQIVTEKDPKGYSTEEIRSQINSI